jgi:hypothetical protein
VNNRYIAAKIFFGMALLFALVGIVLLKQGLPADPHFYPLFFLMIPGLIPFSVAILLACFGVAYFGFERLAKQPVSLPLAVAHLILFLLGMYGHSVVVRFWWRVLGTEHATRVPMPVWSALLSATAFTLSLVLFLLNITWSLQRALRKA